MSLDHEQRSPATQAATTPAHGTRRPAPWIVADNLTKRFGNHTAVDGLTFQVPRGVVTGFLGPNGSGKTTTMRMILGLVRPSAGTATVGGRPFAKLDAPGRQVGVVIDGAAAHPRRTGRDHLRILAAERGVDVGRIPQVLSAVELDDAADRKVGAYSLGMRQRLHLAAALLGEPAALLLDEPGNGLDPAGIRWLRDFLKSYAAAGGTVFVSSHQLDEMSRLADDVVVINRGRLVTQTSVGQLTTGRTVKVTSPQADAIACAVSRAGGVVRSVDGMTLHVSDIAPEDIGAIALRIGALLHELAPRNAALEDVFLELTDNDEGDQS
jgi:ABC-2 type transport system ATP-binding protein